MRTPSLGPPQGWSVVGCAFLVVIALVAVIFVSAGTDQRGLQIAVRATARTSVAFFLLAFVASPLDRLWSTPFSHWVLSNRRQLGVSFAVSHLIHLSAVVALFSLPEWSIRRLVDDLVGRGGNLPGSLIVFFGAIGVLVLTAMAATSFDRTAAWLGARQWKRLHTFGIYYLWFLFFGAFGRRALVDSFYVPIVVTLAAALAFRIGGSVFTFGVRNH